MKKSGEIVLLCALLPSVGYAHGEQVLALPVAQGGVLIVLSVAAFLLKMSSGSRTLFLILPITAMLATWVVPGSVFAPIEQRYGYGYGPVLFFGAVPPLIVAIAVFGIFRAFHGKNKLPNQAPEPTAPSGRGSS
jgi:hypothetical protein